MTVQLHFDYQQDCPFLPEKTDDELIEVLSSDVPDDERGWEDIKPETEKEKVLAALLFRRSATLVHMQQCLDFCAQMARENGEEEHAETLEEIRDGELLIGVMPEEGD